MDDFVLDELVDFFQTSDEFALSTALTLDDLPQDDFSTDADLFLDSSLPNLQPPEPFPAIDQWHNIATQMPPDTFNSGSSNVPQQKHRSKDAIRRSEYRKRQKEEKESLRKEIDELSAKLDKTQDATGTGNTSPSTGVALSNCLWKAIASRQKDHLHAAEKEQLHLRAAISSRATLIEDLCGLLRKRLHDGTNAHEELEDAPRLKKRTFLQPADAALFETFLDELQTVYLQTDEVITACESSLTTECPSVTKFKNGDMECYQHAHRQILPFRYKQTCHSVWHWVQLKHRQKDREIYEKVEDPGNIIAMKFRISSCRMGETVSLLQRVVVRRFQEINRFVVVWKVFSEGEGLFRGMHSNETGWCVVRPATNGSMGGTVMDTCYRRVPMHFSSSTNNAPVVNEFKDLVVSTGDEENKTILRGLEQMLLDDALANGIN